VTLAARNPPPPTAVVPWVSNDPGQTNMALNQQTTVDLRAQLRIRAAQLRREIAETLERSTDESHVRIAEQVRDAEDDSFSNLIVDLNLSDIDRDAQELRRIDSALTRLTTGTYGSCVNCGQEIPVARLKVEPTASRCIACQELYEKTHATGSTPRL
jgi:DnaK suppressor protein